MYVNKSELTFLFVVIPTHRQYNKDYLYTKFTKFHLINRENYIQMIFDKKTMLILKYNINIVKTVKQREV